MANISYQQIREQLINLNVDLEDKSKICKILEQKSKDERNQLGTIESAFEEKYQAIIEVTAGRMYCRLREQKFRSTVYLFSFQLVIYLTPSLTIMPCHIYVERG